MQSPDLHWLIWICACCLFPAAGRAQLTFSPPAGAYAGAVTVELDGAATIHYTLDGSTPTTDSPRYEGRPLQIGRTTVLRALAADTDGQPTGPARGATYLIDEPASDLLTLSVAIDGWRLFDPTRGWFVAGPRADPTHWKMAGANWWTRREHPAYLEILNPAGQPVHSSGIGFRMFGGMSRLHPQKSFSLSARSDYGDRRIDFPLFGAEGNKRFRFLVVRNGGSDWGRSYVRDALLTGLLRDESWDLERQRARPVRVFLNGRYWGLYHLREKINPQYLADHHPVDKDSLDLLEHELTRKHGTEDHYRELQDFISTADPADPDNYRHLGTLMDIDNFQRLQIAQTYFDNRDAGGNIRYWRPRRPDGRFRWILYDVDQGFGLHRAAAWEHNTLAFYTEPAGPQWPNPPWSTRLQRRLLRNADYRRGFVNRSLDYLHTDFAAEAVLEQTEAAIAAVAREMPRHLRRWDDTEAHWQRDLERLREFARRRPAHLREHLREFFRGGADRALELRAGRGGSIELNRNLRVGSDGLTGRYFANFPVHLAARPAPGYRFVGWEGLATEAPATDLTLDRDYTIAATFAAADHPLADQIIINEICPRNRAGGDWVELHNRGEAAAQLGGWFLTDDSGRRFVLPPVELGAGEYLAICQRPDKFRRTYPGVYGVIGGLPFGLNKAGDRLGLYGPDGSYVNAITYAIAPLPDSSFTYALALPGLDNGRHRNWVVEDGPGTPGSPNPRHLREAVVTTQSYWLRIGVGLGVLLLLGVIGAKRRRDPAESE